MVWEYTWPDARLIEVALVDNPAFHDEEDTTEPFEVVNLRLAGSLSTMLREDLAARVVECHPVEHCPDPVALQICRQSRMHTLSRYRVMKSLAWPFYYHPQRDVIFLSVDTTDDYPEHMPVLERYHHTELNTLETALVLNGEWPIAPWDTGSTHVLDYISHLGGLKTVQVLWPESASDIGELMETDGTDDTVEKRRDRGPQVQADRLRSSFSAIIGNRACTAARIELIDLDGNLY